MAIGGAAALREQMVSRQLVSRGIVDPRVLAAMRSVPREHFTAGASLEDSYADSALPIGFSQTVSQPYMVARMVALLELQGHEKVLEVGTGLGYQAAVLARLARKVVTVERIGELASAARETLAALEVRNVEVVFGDGTLGFAKEAPFDAIVVAAAAPTIAPALLAQLGDPGRLLSPIGVPGDQILVRVLQRGGKLTEQLFDRCVFVPLLRGLSAVS